MSYQEAPSIAFVLSLIGGILIFLNGIMFSMWFMFGDSSPWDMMDMMGGWRFFPGFTGGFSVVGLVAGIVVIVGAVMLNMRPAEHLIWGVVVLVFSAISFLDMGGFFIGALLGMAGGALALSWRPVRKA